LCQVAESAVSPLSASKCAALYMASAAL
jgi:hypothetical protein